MRTAIPWFCLAIAFNAFGAESPREAKTTVRSDLVVQVEKELARLKAQADLEPGGEWPRLSTRVAYLLLVGLAADGTPVEGLTETEQIFFGVEKRGGGRGILLEVTPDARIALVDRWIQDKAGTFLERGAHLYVREAGQWIRKGGGSAVGKN